jgi:hypothetical protein
MKPHIPIILSLILMLSHGPLMAQETEGPTPTDSPTASLYNWVNMPDQNPFPRPTMVRGFGEVPQLIDFDGDGDFDAFDGQYYYENLGTAKEPQFKIPPTKITDQFFDGAEIDGYYFKFVDIDNDNDWDAFVMSTQSGTPIKYYENTGHKNTPVYEERTGTANPLASLQGGNRYSDDSFDFAHYSTISFVDLDADQDLDIFFEQQGNLTFPLIPSTTS